jgi:hypothetical protein
MESQSISRNKLPLLSRLSFKALALLFWVILDLLLDLIVYLFLLHFLDLLYMLLL